MLGDLNRRHNRRVGVARLSGVSLRLPASAQRTPLPATLSQEAR